MRTEKISEVLICFLSVGLFLLLVYSSIYFVRKQYYNYLLNTAGYESTATIIRKMNGNEAEYDFKYEGKYYRGYILLKKHAYRKIRIGERFPVLVLPDKLKNYRASGITPPCFKLQLVQLPDYMQDFETEKNRIEEMYRYKVY